MGGDEEEEATWQPKDIEPETNAAAAKAAEAARDAISTPPTPAQYKQAGLLSCRANKAYQKADES